MKYFKFESIAFYILLIFAFIGFLSLSTFLHELSHKNDMKNIAEEGSICLLNIPDNISLKEKLFNLYGSYNFEYPINNETISILDKIKKTTEYKAYKYDFLLGAVLIICYITVIYKRFYGRRPYMPKNM